MLKPVFYTLPGNEKFAPKVSHPGEDAGADIRVFCPKGLSFAADLAGFREECESHVLSIGGDLPLIVLNGQQITGTLSSIFDSIENAVEEHGGAVLLRPYRSTILADTGFKVILPSAKELPSIFDGFVAQYKIVPRSGLAHKYRTVVTNSPGIIDAGYRDWVKVSLTNYGYGFHVFTHGARIAQGIAELAIDQSNAVITNNEADLSKTSRGTTGFGGTGV
jgi:deoxyuridine 5'-triphosphate nucleotidohydrolase